jgi:hypothetical protein
LRCDRGMTRPSSHTYLHTVSAVLPDDDAGDSMEQLIFPLAMDGAVGHSAADRKKRKNDVSGWGGWPEAGGYLNRREADATIGLVRRGA